MPASCCDRSRLALFAAEEFEEAIEATETPLEGELTTSIEGGVVLLLLLQLLVLL